jgi:hypothetical protein
MQAPSAAPVKLDVAISIAIFDNDLLEQETLTQCICFMPLGVTDIRPASFA